MKNETKTETEKQLSDLHHQILKDAEELLQKYPALGKHHSENIDKAKIKWQAAWNEFLETLLVLERLEI